MRKIRIPRREARETEPARISALDSISEGESASGPRTMEIQITRYHQPMDIHREGREEGNMQIVIASEMPASQRREMSSRRSVRLMEIGRKGASYGGDSFHSFNP